MGVDETSLDRIRNATFPSSRRGYDKHEVEKFLGRLADWLETGGGDETRSDAVKRELERVGERTGAILSQAEDSAQQIREEAEEEARGTVNSANLQANETRAEAENFATETKAAAERDAREAIESAQADARRIVEEAEQRREDAEAVVGNLIRRREDVIADTEELSRKLSIAVEQHRSTDLRDLDSLPGGEQDPGAAETELTPDTDPGLDPETDPGLEPEPPVEGQDTEEHTVVADREIEPDPQDTDERDLAQEPGPEQRADLRT
jgi:DivIVA domain-containing protein